VVVGKLDNHLSYLKAITCATFRKFNHKRVWYYRSFYYFVVFLTIFLIVVKDCHATWLNMIFYVPLSNISVSVTFDLPSYKYWL